MTSKYTAAHESPTGAGDMRPTALQIVDDEGRDGRLGDKVMLITGCSSGLGVETARALFATGATLFVTARDPEKARSALRGVIESDRVHLLRLDLNTLDSVRSCASDFLTKSRKLNILINNAGVMHTPEGRTADGFETQFGINHLAHFLLFNLLKSTLLASSTPEFASRVVNLSSSGHRIAGVRLDDFNFEKQPYNGWLAYGQSKTANIYMANEIERRYGEKGLHAISVHPGSILSGLQKTVPDEMRQQWKHESVQKVIKSPGQGAATTVYAAISQQLEGKGGVYVENCAVASQAKDGAQTRDPGYAAYAFDQAKEGRLWIESLKMVHLGQKES